MGAWRVYSNRVFLAPDPTLEADLTYQDLITLVQKLCSGHWPDCVLELKAATAPMPSSIAVYYSSCFDPNSLESTGDPAMIVTTYGPLADAVPAPPRLLDQSEVEFVMAGTPTLLPRSRLLPVAVACPYLRNVIEIVDRALA